MLLKIIYKNRSDLPVKEIRSKRIAAIVARMLLIASLILSTGMTSFATQAAVKPSIAATMKIGTGSIVASFDYYSKADKYVLRVSNAVKNATYSFVSSNPKILTVKANKSDAYLTGLKAGTATITCNQKLSGKTTKIGTCKVTVVSSSYSQDVVPTLPIGTGYTDVIEIINRNNDAAYSFISDNANFSMKETFSTFDDMLFIKHTYTAKAAGTFTVTIKETYNKSTRVVGKIKYAVKKATVEPEETVSLESDIEAFDLINNCRNDVSYIFETGDSNVVEISKENQTVIVKGKSEGSTNINIYENAKAPDKSKLLGTCKITVKKVALEELDVSFDEMEAYAGDDPVSVEVTKEPEDAYGTITVASSNPEIAAVSSIDEDGFFEVTPVSAGTATITITCGTVTKTQTFTVTDEEGSDDEYDEGDE